MNSFGLALIAALTLFTAAGCGGSSSPTTQDQPRPSTSPVQTVPATDQYAEARKTFEQRCAACHGEKGEGGTVKVEEVKLTVPNLGSEHAREHTDDQLIRQITNGGEGMPAFRDKLTAEEIERLVRFIRHEFQGS